MLIAENLRWRHPTEVPTRRERLMGIVVRMQWRTSRILATADTRFWRVGDQNYWGPPNAAMPIVWEDLGHEVLAWAVKRPAQMQRAA